MSLNESIRYHELKGVVFPLISIDEFEPKTGTESEVIVVGLFCREEAAAIDLRDFLEKGVTDTLDIDTSPAADEEGRYMVFIELKRNKDFWEDMKRIIADATRLAGDVEWRVVTYLNNKGFSLDDPELRKFVITDPKNYMTKENFQMQVKDSVSDFFADSEVDEAEIKEGRLHMKSGHNKMDFIYESIGDCDYDGGFEMKNVPCEVTGLQNLLGNQYSVNFKSSKLYVENLTNGSVLVLKRYE